MNTWIAANDKSWRKTLLSTGEPPHWKLFAYNTDKGPQAHVILRYRWSDTQSFAIGAFDSVAEAIFAANLYGRGPDTANIASAITKLGLRPWSIGYRLAVDDGHFILIPGDAPDCITSISYVGDSSGTGLNATLTSANHQPIYRLPNIEDHASADITVALALLRFRLLRGPGRYATAMTRDDLDALASTPATALPV